MHCTFCILSLLTGNKKECAAVGFNFVFKQHMKRGRATDAAFTALPSTFIAPSPQEDHPFANET